MTTPLLRPRPGQVTCPAGRPEASSIPSVNVLQTRALATEQRLRRRRGHHVPCARALYTSDIVDVAGSSPARRHGRA